MTSGTVGDVTHHLVGVHEIADMLGVTRQRVDQLSRGDDFPAPVIELRSGRIWRRADVERWAKRTGRTVKEER